MGNRLLLADDSITIQKVVAIIFANEEFELTVVDNGIAALQKAREVRPDVMLVDALMPGKSGYEVCAEIRRDPALSSTPILLLIGAFEPFDEEKARECGADSSITKPFESQQLIDRVKELLELGKTRVVAPAPAAPAAAPLPLESAAEELWGDLSSFDTMAPPVMPVAAPTAAAPAEPASHFFNAPEAQPAPVAPAPAATAPVAPAAAAPAPAAPAPAAPAYSAPQPAVVPQAPAAVAQPSEPIVEANYEDDLWGAFELEELPDEAAAPSATGLAGGEEFEAEEFFSFEDESDAIEETGPEMGTAGAVQGVGQPSAEELFSFADETPIQPDPFGFPVEEPFSFEPEAEAPINLFVSEPVVAAAPKTPAAAPSTQYPAQAATADWEGEGGAIPQVSPAQPAAPASFTLSEADLVAALSRVSREVIERIVWEVVPDLAEVLIKEEIRKLKAGIKG
jgi:CheY-like chemotaxis protein